MKAKQVIANVQEALLIPEAQRFPNIGPLTRGRFEYLRTLKPEDEYTPDVISLSKPGEGARDINARGLALVKHFESCFLTAYKDSVGVWTIGWGHTGLQHNDGTVYKGRTITQAKAEQLLQYDMEQFEARVEALVKVPLNDDQFAALVSFDFNTGGLAKSTLLKLLNGSATSGTRDALFRVGQEFKKWDNATVPGRGRVKLAGLTRRRWSESRLFLGQEPYLLKDMEMLHKAQAGEI